MVLNGKRWKTYLVNVVGRWMVMEKVVRFDSLGITTLMMDENLTMLGENMIKLYTKCWQTKNEYRK